MKKLIQTITVALGVYMALKGTASDKYNFREVLEELKIHWTVSESPFLIVEDE